MATQTSGAWICSSCRSINQKRTSSCYRCHAPRELTGATADTLPTVGGEVAPAALRPYRDAGVRALLVLPAIVLAFAATTALTLWAYPAFEAELSLQVRAAFPDVVPLLVTWLLALTLAMACWAAWISRVVDNLPALGLGYSRVTPRWAVVEALLPGPNILTALARIREALVRLDPSGHGVGLVTLSWLFAFGPWVLLALYSRVARFVLGSVEVGREILALLPALWVASAIGVLFLLVAVVRVQLLCAARHASAGSRRT